jgi:hypothetical protein
MQIRHFSHNPIYLYFTFTLILSSYVPNLNILSQTDQKLWPCLLFGPNHPPSWIYANLCKLEPFLKRFKSYGIGRYLGQIASAILDLCKLDSLPTIPFAISIYVPYLNVLAQTDQKLWPCLLFGPNRPTSWIFATLGKLNPFSGIQFAIPAYVPNLNGVSQTVQKLRHCPLSGSNSVRHLGFMQIRPTSHNPFHYINPCTKFECYSSNGSKVMAVSVT